MSSNVAKISFLIASLASIPPPALALIETCEDLQGAVDDLQDGDVTVYMYPFADIECDTFTTFNITQNHLYVLSSEDLDNYSGNSNLERGRFEVHGSAELTWETNLVIDGFDELQDVDGGAIYIHEGGSVSFLNDLTMEDVGVKSVTDEDSDFSSNDRAGGCVWTAGYFLVEGLADFDGCEITGGGESSPGPGGAIYVEETGVVVFNGGLEIQDVSILDDEGGNGGGIYNKGTVNITGQSYFESLYAQNAGAIYNAEGAFFRFKAGDTVAFTECKSFDGFAGSIYNAGYMEFTGAALFFDGKSSWRGGAIVVADSGETILAENTVLFLIKAGDVTGAAVYVYSGGKVDIPDTIVFVDTTDDDTECEGIYFQDGEVCEA